MISFLIPAGVELHELMFRAGVVQALATFEDTFAFSTGATVQEALDGIPAIARERKVYLASLASTTHASPPIMGLASKFQL